jgi:stage II sporulation protein D
LDRRAFLAAGLQWAPGWAAAATASRYPPFVPLTERELFESRFRFRPQSPALSVGLAEGRDALEVGGAAPLRLFFDEGGIPKRAFFEGPVRLVPDRVDRGLRRHWVLMEAFPYEALDRAEAAAERLGRRHGRARIFTLGTVVGLAGRVVDTRQHRVGVLGSQRRAEAESLRTQVFRERGRAPAILSESARRPTGRVQVRAAGRLLHVAEGRVCLTTARDSLLEWKGRGRFAGELYAVPDHAGGLSLVNTVAAERMLAGLIPAEMFASAPEEALKAQAVTARGAVFAKLGHRHLDAPFHLCAQEHCQVYRGVSKEHPRTTRAVEATRGLLAVRPGSDTRLIASVYSSTCGGFSENNDVVWDQEPAESLRGRIDGPEDDPALAPFADGLNEDNIRAWVESYPPTYESRSSFVREDNYRWTRRFTTEELAALDLGVGEAKRIEILGRGPGGRVTGVRVWGTAGQREILRELPVRRAFGNLKSGMFVVDHERDADGRLIAVKLTGGGWGHGSGMCQVGAIGRAEQGHSFKEILAHYYNGAVVKRFY